MNTARGSAGPPRPSARRSVSNMERLIDIQPNGEANFCVDLPDGSLGDVRRSSIAEIWNGEPARRFREARRQHPFGRAPVVAPPGVARAQLTRKFRGATDAASSNSNHLIGGNGESERRRRDPSQPESCSWGAPLPMMSRTSWWCRAASGRCFLPPPNSRSATASIPRRCSVARSASCSPGLYQKKKLRCSSFSSGCAPRRPVFPSRDAGRSRRSPWRPSSAWA